MSTPIKSKLAVSAATMRGGFDLYASASSSTGTSASAEASPSVKQAPGLNSRFRMDPRPGFERFVMSSPPGIAQRVASPSLPPVPELESEDADLIVNGPRKNFLTQMRTMFDKTTAQKTPETSNQAFEIQEPTVQGGSFPAPVAPPLAASPLGLDLATSVTLRGDKALAAAIAKKCKEELEPIIERLDVSTKVKRIESVLRHVTAVSLKAEYISYVGKMQRQLANTHVRAENNGKRLEVWFKEVDKESDEQAAHNHTEPAIDKPVEECKHEKVDATIDEPVDECKEDKSAVDGIEELIVARIWKRFKEHNPACEEERGSDFFKTWKEDIISNDPLLRYIVNAGSNSESRTQNRANPSLRVWMASGQT